MKKSVYVADYSGRFISRILAMLFVAAILIVCIIFLHFDFLKSGLWWVLFSLVGLSEFLALLGRKGIGQRALQPLGDICGLVVTILSFICFWWQGGVAIIVSWIIWLMFLMPLIDIIVLVSRTTPSNNPNDRL